MIGNGSGVTVNLCYPRSRHKSLRVWFVVAIFDRQIEDGIASLRVFCRSELCSRFQNLVATGRGPLSHSLFTRLNSNNRFVVAQCVARPVGRPLVCTPPAMLFCVETSNKLPYHEPLGVQLRKSYVFRRDHSSNARTVSV